MVIRIKLGGFLRNKVSGHKGGVLDIELEEHATVADAVRALGLRPENVKLILRNHRAAQESTVLEDGDRLGLWPPQLAYNTFVALYFSKRGSSGEDNP
jgi:sulfur carrier protein ThiS